MDRSVATNASRPARRSFAAPGHALPWLIWLGAIGTDVVGVGIALDAIRRPGGFEQSILTPLASLTFAIAFASVGLLLQRRRRGEMMGWLLLAFGLLAGVGNLCWGAMVAGAEPGGNLDWGVAAAWLLTVIVTPLWIALGALVVVAFPNGLGTDARKRRLAAAAAAAVLWIGLSSALASGPFVAAPAFDNPLALPEPFGTAARLASAAGVGLAAVVLGLAVRGLVRRHRVADVVERHQIRWFAFGGGVLVPTGIAYALAVLLAPDRAALRDLLYIVLMGSTVILPVAILLAITRHRLYDIDRIIGRTVVFGALTAILAGIYAATIRSFNALFVAITGEESEAALVFTTLVLTITFTPMKSRLEKLAATRFGDDPPATTPPASPTPEPAVATPEPASTGDLEARMEAIARRVAEEVVAARSERPRSRPVD